MLVTCVVCNRLWGDDQNGKLHDISGEQRDRYVEPNPPIHNCPADVIEGAKVKNKESDEIKRLRAQVTKQQLEITRWQGYVDKLKKEMDSGMTLNATLNSTICEQQAEIERLEKCRICEGGACEHFLEVERLQAEIERLKEWPIELAKVTGLGVVEATPIETADWIADACNMIAQLKWKDKDREDAVGLINIKLRDAGLEIERLKAGKFTKEEFHLLCHETGKPVTAEEFAIGCCKYQEELFGNSPTKDRIAYLEKQLHFTNEALNKANKTIDAHQSSTRTMAIGLFDDVEDFYLSPEKMKDQINHLKEQLRYVRFEWRKLKSLEKFKFRGNRDATYWQHQCEATQRAYEKSRNEFEAVNEEYLSLLKVHTRISKELEAIKGRVNTPHTDEFFESVRLEAAYQLVKWSTKTDEGKEPEDWFWLLGHLSGKAVSNLRIHSESGIGKDPAYEKGKHHIISSAAVLLNWFRNVSGDNRDMQPGTHGLEQEGEPSAWRRDQPKQEEEDK